MTIKTLLDPAIQDFIRSHENADVSALALKKPPQPDWPYPEILNQIRSRQKAQKKIPEWLEQDGIIWPHPDIMEQASSAATAAFKANLCRGKRFVDLTAGAGINACAITRNFERADLIDIDPDNAAKLTHNLGIFGLDHGHVHTADAADYLRNMEPVDWIFIDPARRDDRRRGKSRLQDTRPNVIELLPGLKQKAGHLLLKTSPFLDIQQCILELDNVTDVYIIEHQNECKEVLYVLNFTNSEKIEPKIHAISFNNAKNNTNKHSFTTKEEKEALESLSNPLKYIYEPGPALMKSGGFKTLGKKYGLSKLHPHTHLYTSDKLIKDFPGRSFELTAQYPPHKKHIPHSQANLTIRNFPGHIDQLRRQLGLKKDGGAHYLFACTLQNGDKIILDCIKTPQ